MNIRDIIKRVFFGEVDSSSPKTTMRAGNTRVEYLQDWGFISIPKSGEGIVIYPDGSNTGVLVKADDPKNRPEGFAVGDTGLYNSSGVVIKLSGTSVTIYGTTDIILGDQATATALVREVVLPLLASHSHTGHGVVSTTLATLNSVANKTTTVKGS